MYEVGYFDVKAFREPFCLIFQQITIHLSTRQGNSIKTEKDYMGNLNLEVTKFLDELHHPLRAGIEQLRLTILNADGRITENIKWNGPNYCFENQDRITMRIHPPKQIQIIFHRGANKLTQPKDKIIDDNSGLLIWKENDRAVASFKNKDDIEKSKAELENIVNKWIKATKSTTTNR